MAEKRRGKSRRRSDVARRFIAIGRLDKNLPADWSFKGFLVGLLLVVLTTAVLMDYEFQTFTDYQLGDIAERTIEASQDFTVEDREATAAKLAEALAAVPVVFSYDVRVNHDLAQAVRMDFADARAIIAETREARGIPEGTELPEEILAELRSEIEEQFPRFAYRNTIDICLKFEFSQELEDQLVTLLVQAMKSPGVVFNREALLRHQGRQIILHHEFTGEREALEDWLALRDLGQAKDLLRQEEYQLTVVTGQEKLELIDFLDRLIAPNTSFDPERTMNLEEAAREEVAPVLLQIRRGRTLVRAGDEITESSLNLLRGLEAVKDPGRSFDRMIGVFVIVSFFFFALYAYFQLHLVGKHESRSDFLLVVLVLLTNLILVRAVIFLSEIVAGSARGGELQDPNNYFFFAPVALGAVLTLLLVGLNLSLYCSVISAVFVGILTGELNMTIYTLAGSLVAIYALKQYRERSALIRAGMVIAGVNVLIIFALQLLSGGTFQVAPITVRFSAGIASGLSIPMLTSLLLPTLESLFGLTTDIRLLELSNLNSPILRRMALEAPGTYHHSISVGTLAEAGASAIDANTLLIRVGAYYHDIGKLKHPEYYVENQIYMANKHESLSPTMSSLILSSHVKDGLAMAAEIRLGPKVAALIPQHHGTRVMTYFYQKARETAAEKNREVNEDDFRYPGPKPQSKEAAILMIADQVEAASRTLQEPSPGQIRSLIRRITQATIQDGQLSECDITMKELGEVAKAFERVLTGMYHHRIEYPGFDFNKRNVEASRVENQSVQ
jgi:putative nucleotidyltransferase with HDIG domain